MAAFSGPEHPDPSPSHIDALHYAFNEALESRLGALWQFALIQSNFVLNPYSEEYFRRTKDTNAFGDAIPKGEVKEIREGAGEVEGGFWKD